MLIDTIRETSLEYRKNRHPLSGTLISLISDIVMSAKNDGNREPTDTDTIKIIRKYSKTADENINLMNERGKDSSQYLLEKQCVESFLPKMLSEEELEKEIDAILSTVSGPITKKHTGTVMAGLKTKFPDMYDPRLASAIVGKKIV